MGRSQARLALALALAGGGAFGGAIAAVGEEVRSVGGRYRVTGVTLDKETLERREISGTITLRQTGTRFTSHFEFRTQTPGSPITPAKVLGTGEGEVRGDLLEGHSDIQLQSSKVPGLDVEFGMVPHQAISTRIRSSWVAQVGEDGTIAIESENEPWAGGTSYSPTHTSLTGKRISDAPPAPEAP